MTKRGTKGNGRAWIYTGEKEDTVVSRVSYSGVDLTGRQAFTTTNVRAFESDRSAAVVWADEERKRCRLTRSRRREGDGDKKRAGRKSDEGEQPARKRGRG